MVDYVFPQNYITLKKTCCVSDDLSGDMLALSWPNLVIILFFMFIVMYLYNLVEYTSHQIKHITIISVYSLFYYSKLFNLHLRYFNCREEYISG